MFGAVFTTRRSERLRDVFAGAAATAEQAAEATATVDPQTLATLPEPVREGIITAYAEALAPVFWYVIPFMAAALVLAIFLRQVPLSDQAGLVAPGRSHRRSGGGAPGGRAARFQRRPLGVSRPRAAG